MRRFFRLSGDLSEIFWLHKNQTRMPDTSMRLADANCILFGDNALAELRKRTRDPLPNGFSAECLVLFPAPMEPVSDLWA
jgi:hypothetical protein